MENIRRLCVMELYTLWELRPVRYICLGISVLFALSTRLMPAGFFVNLYLLVACTGSRHLSALPVDRRQIVQARYLFAALCLLGQLAVLLAVNRAAAPLLPAELNPGGTGTVAALQFLGGALVVALTQPMLLCLDAVKARYGIVLVYLASFSGMFRLLSEYNRSWQSVCRLRAFLPWIWLAGAALLALSYVVSVRLSPKIQLDS